MIGSLELVPTLFFVVGFVVLLLFALMRSSSGPTEGVLRGARSSISTRQLVVTLILVIVTFDVVLASVRILYPEAELKIESASFADVVKSALWPIAFVIFLVFFSQPLSEFFKNITKARLKFGDSEVELGKEAEQVGAVSAALAAAAAAVPPSEGAVIRPPDSGDIAQLAKSAVRAVRSTSSDLDQQPRVLWADDRPTNNTYLRDSLEKAGIRVDLALNTDDALAAVARRTYDAVISDMGRPPDMEAGYTLLSQLQKLGFNLPYIIFAGSNLEEHRVKALERGAIASTNNPTEVFRLVTALVQKRLAPRS